MEHTRTVELGTSGPATRQLAATDQTATSLFVTGEFPLRQRLILSASVLAGFILTVVWSYEFVDQTIGDNVANGLLGHDAKETPISGIGAGIIFAFVSGLAGTFTACNVAAFSAICPVLGSDGNRWRRLTNALRPIGWLSVGTIAVSAIYGAIVGIVGTSMPQFSTSNGAPGTLSPPLVQAMIIFGSIGLFMCYLGLAALGLVRDPFASIVNRHHNAPMVFMGALIGGFLIGRPFPLFRQMFRDAAESHNPLYGAFAFTLQSIGNIAIMTVLLVLITFTVGARVQRWLSARPGRSATITAVSFITAGSFLFLYWDVRLPAVVKVLPWYPTAPWA